MSVSAMTVITNIFTTLIALCAILALVDMWTVNSWNSWVLILGLVILFYPTIGEVFAIGLIIYWFVTTYSRSHLINKFTY